MLYICPICSAPLSLNGRTFACENRHSFDLAKEGYVNLMPANHKHSKNPGDSTEMMQARRQFLQSGQYQPLQEAIAQTLLDSVQQPEAAILDIGCGEGYYTNAIAGAFPEPARVYGLDISKVAVRYAAKQYKSCHFSVGSSYRLPFPEHSLDAIVKVYAPSSPSELLRCLKPGGKLITVTPGARHLFELRERIYQEVRLHQEQAEEIEGFHCVRQDKLSYQMSLDNGLAFDLLQMTPFAWKASDELREELRQAQGLNCEADFNINVYEVSVK